jgi:hypothetical protein
MVIRHHPGARIFEPNILELVHARYIALGYIAICYWQVAATFSFGIKLLPNGLCELIFLGSVIVYTLQ